MKVKMKAASMSVLFLSSVSFTDPTHTHTHTHTHTRAHIHTCTQACAHTYTGYPKALSDEDTHTQLKETTCQLRTQQYEACRVTLKTKVTTVHLLSRYE